MCISTLTEWFQPSRLRLSALNAVSQLAQLHFIGSSICFSVLHIQITDVFAAFVIVTITIK